MARIEKLSRIRGLNPYEVKKTKQEKSLVDENAFSDIKTINFNQTQSINFPSMLPSTSELLTSELSTSISINAKTPINAESSFFYQINPSVDNPFNDSKINLLTSSYYATGSSVVGFSGPLKDKTIISLELPLSSEQNLTSKNSKENPFGYYNFDTKTIDQIGINSGSAELAFGAIGINSYFTEKAFGFGPSIVDTNKTYQAYQSDDIYENLGLPISDFGFPSSPTYRGSSKNLLNLGSYIKEPFVLEKIQIQIEELSCVMNDNLNFTTSSIALATIFLMNQRKSEIFIRNSKYKYFQFFDNIPNFPSTPNSIFTNLELPYIHAGSETNDLIGFYRMGCVYADSNIENKIRNNIEYLASNEGTFAFSLSEENLIEFAPNVATKNDYPPYLMYFIDNPLGTQRVFSQKLSTFNGTRSNAEDFSLRNQIKQIASEGKVNLSDITNSDSDKSVSLGFQNSAVVNIPYILLPEDNLILGFQAPIFDHSSFLDILSLTSRGLNFFPPGETDVATLSISGKIKITLFGSYLKMNDSLDYIESHKYDSNESALNTISTINIGEKK